MHPSIRRQTIADALRRSALRLPAKAAIICGLTTWTYGEFDALVSRLAAGLATRGVQTGDRVAVLARNSHGFAALRFALQVLRQRGQVSDAELAAVRLAGFDEASVLEIVINVSLNVLTNYFNNVAQTDIDFPKVIARLSS